MPPPAPLVSVLMVTYNHERCIRTAVESALAQETTFPFEIVIGEDCSTDGTRAVLQELSRAHPGRLQLRLHPRNLGAGANLADVFAASRGTFIAMLEGDDYWTDSRKLQRQVDFLTAHPECALCFHDVLLIDEASGRAPQRFYGSKPAPFTTSHDLLASNFIATCSVMYRRAALPATLPAYIAGLPMQDWPTWFHVSQSGTLGYLDECWACYRIHAGGVWSGLHAAGRVGQIERLLRTLAREFPQHAAGVRQQIALRRKLAAAACLENGQRGRALGHLVHCVGAPEQRSAVFWLAFEAVFGRWCVDRVKRLYGRLRGHAPA